MAETPKKSMTKEERVTLLNFLLQQSLGGRLQRGDIAEAAQHFNMHRNTVSRLWKRYITSIREGNPAGDVSSRIKGNSGRTGYDLVDIRRRILLVPHHHRMCMRSLATRLSVSTNVVHKLLVTGKLKRHSSSLHPLLTDANKLQRLQFALSWIGEHDERNGRLFSSMYNVVHVDEKWFNENVDRRTFYLLPGEALPLRQRESKRFIGKTMFLAAVAKPRYDPHTKKMFDGKLGIWPFTHKVTAKRASRNRPQGTLETKNLASIDHEVYKRYLIDKLIPSIKLKWPRGDKSSVILIQQNNARPHVPVNDPDVVATSTSDGWNIRMMCQPPNSPDFNELDLRYFASIQSLQYQTDCKGIDDLIAAVTEAYNSLDSDKLVAIFLTLQKVLECSMRVGGNNNYTVPHAGKQRLRHAGCLPCSSHYNPVMVANAEAPAEQMAQEQEPPKINTFRK